MNDSNYHRVELASCLLASVLGRQGQLGDQTRGLYERILANSIETMC
jgi:hypothetical protein